MALTEKIKMAKTQQQDFTKSVTEYFSMFPKTQEEFKAAFEKSKTVILAETKKSTDMWDTYKKASSGDATANEIAAANKAAAELGVTARFATLMALPGGVFMLPALAKISKEYNLDLIPASVAKEFNI